MKKVTRKTLNLHKVFENPKLSETYLHQAFAAQVEAPQLRLGQALVNLLTDSTDKNVKFMKYQFDNYMIGTANDFFYWEDADKVLKLYERLWVPILDL